MWAKRCAPTDALGVDLAAALALLREHGILHCEIRTVDGVDLVDSSPSRWRQASDLIRREGLWVALLDAQVGWAAITTEPARQRERLQRALELATLLQAPYLRVYSFLVAKEELDGRRSQVIDRLAHYAEEAAGSGVALLVENCPGTYAQSGKRLSDLAGALASPSLGVAFNPAGFVRQKEHPFLSAFMAGSAKNRIRCLRINDALFADGQAVLPDEGNAELKELISALLCRCYDGFYSLDAGLQPAPATLAAVCQSLNAMVDSLV